MTENLRKAQVAEPDLKDLVLLAAKEDQHSKMISMKQDRKDQ
jgi:hypothetical protein